MDAKQDILVDQRTLRALVVMSFRYALGRRTYAVGEAAGYVRQFVAHLAPWQREQMVRDIEDAIDRGEAGSSMDVDTWRELAMFLRRSLDGEDVVHG